MAEKLSQFDYYSTFYDLTHPSAALLSEKIASLAPGALNHVYFANSGSVANDSAIRILHHYFNRLGKPNKKKILSRIGAYHGSTHMAVAMTTPAYWVGWDSADELVHFLSSPYAYRRPDGMNEAEFLDFLIDELSDAIEKIGADNIAFFHRRADHERRRRYRSARGLSRTHRLGLPPARHHVYLGRGGDGVRLAGPYVRLSGRLWHRAGYQPMSATIVSDKIHEVISGPDGMFLHGMTYSGHPACSAAALANIAILEEEDICGRVRRLDPIFGATLGELADLPIVGEVRGSHFMMGIEFVKDQSTKEVFDAEARCGPRFSRHAQDRGLVVRPLAHMAVLSPVLILTEAEIHTIADTLRKSIKATADDLAREGLL